MKKEFLKIAVALLVLFGLAIPLSLYRERKMKKEEADDAGKNFISFDLKKIDRFQVNNSVADVELIRRKQIGDKFDDEFAHRNFEFQKRPPEWLIVSPVRGLADTLATNNFLEQISKLSYQKVIQENQDRRADYQLDKPRLTVRLFEGDQKEPKLTLYMGSENPSASGYYFATSDRPGIYLGDRAMQPYIEQPVRQWKEARIVEFPENNLVKKIVYTHPSKTFNSFQLSRDDADWKFVPANEIVNVDQRVANDFVTHINGIRAREIFDDPKVLKDSKKLTEIDLHLKDRPKPFHLTIYDGGKEDYTYYIVRDDLKEIFSVAKDPKLVLAFQSLVDKRILTQPWTDFVALKVSKPGSTIELKKEGEVWKGVKPFLDEVSLKRLESFIKVIDDYQPAAYIPHKTFQPDQLKLKVEYESKNQKKGAIAFYKEGKNSFVMVEQGKLSKVFSIADISSDLFEHMSHFRNDDLLTIADDQIETIALSRAGSKVEIAMNPKTYRWHVRSLENVSAGVSLKWKEQLTAEELYNRVSEMYIVDFLKEADAGEAYDTATLVVMSKTNQEHTWKFGKKHGEMVNVYSPERNIHGRLPYVKYKELAEFLDEPEKTKK